MPDPDAEIQAIRVILPRPQNFRIVVGGVGTQGAQGPPGEGASVTSAEIYSLAQTASAAATSADNHANTVSARVVSVSNQLGSLLASASAALESHINAVSAAGGGGGSMTSNEISVLVQVASLAATNAELHANIVSARVVSISNELGSLIASTSLALETHINAVSAAGVTGGASITSQEVSVLVQAASAAATSADNHANIVSARAVSISNELGSLLASTSANLKSIIGASVQVASAAATSADAHANTVSARAVSISNELGSLLASASLALETHINAVSAAGVTGGASVTSNEVSILVQVASAAATSVNSRVTSVNTALSAISALSTGSVSTHGLQSVVNALSARIVTIGSSGTTVTVSGSDFVSTGTGTNDITGLSVSVAASHIYEVEAWLAIKMQDANGVKFGMLNTGTDSGSNILQQAPTTSTTVNTQTLGANGPAGSTVCFDTSPEHFVLFHGTVNVGGSGGVIKIQGQKQTGSTFTCRIGSWLRVTQRK